MKKETQYFLGYFLVFPLIFVISLSLWGLAIQSNGWWEVFSDSSSILGLYYLITSIFFCVFLYRKHR